MIDAGIRHVLVRNAGDDADDPDPAELGGAAVTGIVAMRDVVGFLLVFQIVALVLCGSAPLGVGEPLTARRPDPHPAALQQALATR